MAIAFDIATTAVAYAATGTQTTSHVASASARGAVVMIAQNASAADQVSGVTYDGQPMVRVSFSTEPTEAGAVYIYWLGPGGITPGTQNVAMTTTGTANKQLCVATMTVTTSGATVGLASFNSAISASAANPTVTLTGLTTGIPVSAFVVIHSGLQTMTTTVPTGWTRISSTDLGSQGRGFAQDDVTPSGTTLIGGWTAATAEDYVISIIGFVEVPPIPPLLALGLPPLAAWLDPSSLSLADGASVTSWNDSGPNANHLTMVSGTAPIYRASGGPKDMAYIDHVAPGGLYNDISAGLPSGDLTFFAVVKSSARTVAAQSLLNGRYAWTGQVWIHATGYIELIQTGVASVAISDATIELGRWSIILATFKSIGSEFYTYINGTEGTIYKGGTNTFSYITNGLAYGVDGWGSVAHFEGMTAEIGMYSSVLSAPDQAALLTYLNDKYYEAPQEVEIPFIGWGIPL